MQMASPGHELPLSKLVSTFVKVILVQKEKCRPRIKSWDLVTNITSNFDDDQGGEFIADISFYVKSFTLLHLEMAFSQSQASIHKKIARIMESVILLEL
jgi:hypothetical protein